MELALAELNFRGQEEPRGPGQITIYTSYNEGGAAGFPEDRGEVFRVVEVGEFDGVQRLRTARYGVLIAVREQVIGFQGRTGPIIRIADQDLLSVSTAGVAQRLWYVERSYYVGPSSPPPSSLIPADPAIYGYPPDEQPSIDAVRFLRENLPSLARDLRAIEAEPKDDLERGLGDNSIKAGLTDAEFRDAVEAAETLLAETGVENAPTTANPERISKARKTLAYTMKMLRDYTFREVLQRVEHVVGPSLKNVNWLHHVIKLGQRIVHAASVWLSWF